MATSLYGQLQVTDANVHRVSEADEAGEKFCQLFFETIDKRRQVSDIVTVK